MNTSESIAKIEKNLEQFSSRNQELRKILSTVSLLLGIFRLSMRSRMDNYSMVKNLWLLRLFLLLAPGILAEILSGNTPIMKLFNPVDLFLLVLAYGVPVSLIWEYKVKYSLSF